MSPGIIAGIKRPERLGLEGKSWPIRRTTCEHNWIASRIAEVATRRMDHEMTRTLAKRRDAAHSVMRHIQDTAAALLRAAPRRGAFT